MTSNMVSERVFNLTNVSQHTADICSAEAFEAIEFYSNEL